MQGLNLRKNDYVAINGRPYKAVGVSFHGYNKCYVDIIGIDIFTGEILKCQLLSTDLIDTPTVVKKVWELVSFPLGIARVLLTATIQVNIDDGYLNLMDSEGLTKDEVKVPEGDPGKDITGDFEHGKDLGMLYMRSSKSTANYRYQKITIESAMDIDGVKSYHEAKKI